MHDDARGRFAEQGAVILDDGSFYIELNGNHRSEDAPGFLQRRCYFGVTTPGGYECLGSFDLAPDGKWRASIDAAYDEATDSDSRVLGEFTRRVDAVAALWYARHQAYRRHPD